MDEPAVYKLVIAGFVFANLIAAVLLWRLVAPEGVAKAYTITAVVIGIIAGGIEFFFVDRLLFPERSLSPSLAWILGIGLVAALLLSIWVGSQSQERPPTPVHSDPLRQEIRNYEQQAEQNRAAVEKLQELRERRATMPATRHAPPTRP